MLDQGLYAIILCKPYFNRMKDRSCKIIFYAFLALLLHNRYKAQCSGCTYVLNDNSITTYTVTSGNIVCIPLGFAYTGALTLQGGVICNEGIISNGINFKSGTFNNYGIYNTAAAQGQTVSLNGKVIINNLTGGQFNVSKDFQITAANPADSLCLIIPKGSLVDIGTDFFLNSGRLRINLGGAETNYSPNNLSTKFSVHGNLSLKATCLLRVEKEAQLIVTGDMSFLNAGFKTLQNYGQANLGNFYISGDGMGSTEIQIVNKGTFQAGTFQSTIMNAVLAINNNSSMVLNGMELNSLSTVFNNTQDLTLSQLTLLAGEFINTGTFNSNSVDNSAIFTNNSKATVTGHFINQPNSTLNNTDYLIVTANFLNMGTCMFGKASYLKAFDFDNSQPTSVIIGPPDLLDDMGNPDDVNYSRIVIDENSRNAGVVDGYVEFTDVTFIPPGVDVIDASSFFGPNVVLAGGNLCKNDVKFGYLSVTPNKLVFCQGENATITLVSLFNVAGLNMSYTGTDNGEAYGINNSLIIYGIQTGGTVIFTGTYFNGIQNCPFTLQVVFTIGNTQITSPSPLPFVIGNQLTLNSTVSNANPPMTFNWQPNAFFVPPSTSADEDPVVSPEVSLIYTVTATDSYGCKAVTTVQVIAQPYAHLNKIPDGGYYKAFNNKLLFKYDGQYALTSMTYKVFDKTNAVIASNTANNIVSSTIVNSGDNRYYLDISAGAFVTGNYYTLELTNEKKEKLYLRFIK